MTENKGFLLLLFAHMNVGVVLRTSLHFLRFRFLQHPLTNEKRRLFKTLSSVASFSFSKCFTLIFYAVHCS